MAAGECSQPFVLETRDAQGAPTAGQNEALSVMLDFVLGLKTFADAQCTLPFNDLTVVRKQDEAQFRFYLQPTQVLSTTLVAHLSGRTLTASQPLSIHPGPAKQLIFTTPNRTVSVGACSSALTISSADLAGNESAVSTGVALQLTSSGTPATFFTGPGCTFPFNGTLQLSAGQSSVSVYFRGSMPGALDVQVDAAGVMGAAQTQTIVAGPPGKLVFQNAILAVTAGQCAGPIYVQSQDLLGFPAPPGQPFTIQLAGTAFETFSDAACTVGAPSLTLVTSSSTFYVRSTLAGTRALTASAFGLAPATLMVPVVAASAAKLVFATPERYALAGECSLPVTIERRDAFDNPAPGPALAITVDPYDMDLYSDPACTIPATSFSFPQNGTSITVYFRESLALGYGIRAWVLFPPYSYVEQPTHVVAGPAVALWIFNGSPFFTAGTCTDVIEIHRVDSYGNPASNPSSATVTLSSDAGITFFPGMGCVAPSNTVTIQPNFPSTYVSLRTTIAGTHTIDVTTAGLNPGSKAVTFRPASPSVLAFTTAPHAVSALTCSPPVVVQSQDAFGNASPTRSPGLVIDLSGTPALSPTFGVGAICSGTSQLFMDAGVSELEFSFAAASPGALEVKAEATGFTPAVQTHSVSP